MQPLQIELHRHPIKSGEFLPQQMNPTKDIVLPVEGLQQAQAEAAKFAEEFAEAPEGTVAWSLASTAPRTQEAQFIFDMELKALARKLKEKTGEEISIIDLSGEMPDEKIAYDIESAVTEDGQKKKIILTNGPKTQLLGPHGYDIPAYDQLAKDLGSEEVLISGWQSDSRIGQIIEVEYEDVANGFEKLMGNITQVSTNLLADRNVWVKAFGHSAEIEVALATWSNRMTKEVVSLGSGGIVGFLESARVGIKPDGQQSIVYRGEQI